MVDVPRRIRRSPIVVAGLVAPAAVPVIAFAPAASGPPPRAGLVRPACRACGSGASGCSRTGSGSACKIVV